MSSGISGRSTRIGNYGITVVRATSALPQTTNAAIFNVNAGRVLLTGIWGLVTTAIQAQANNYNLTTNSTTGNITSNLCAVLDITGLAVGNMLGITGTPATAMSAGSNVPQCNEVIVAPGTIRAVAAASSTGAVQWNVTYIPLDDGASITAA